MKVDCAVPAVLRSLNRVGPAAAVVETPQGTFRFHPVITEPRRFVRRYFVGVRA